jgi:hypothetical protein
MSQVVTFVEVSWVYIFSEYFECTGGTFVGGRMTFHVARDQRLPKASTDGYDHLPWRSRSYVPTEIPQDIEVCFWRDTTSQRSWDDTQLETDIPIDIWKCTMGTWRLLKYTIADRLDSLPLEIKELRESIKYHPSGEYAKQMKLQYSSHPSFS